ncbi:hypothetical protein [Frankia sp. CcWB3]
MMLSIAYLLLHYVPLDTFPCTSITKRACASSFSNRSFSARSFSNSRFRSSVGGRPFGFDNPANAPASRAFRHSAICAEYRSSRRKIAPFCPSAAASYSVKIRSLYAAVNDRRRAFGSTSGSGRDRPPLSRSPTRPSSVRSRLAVTDTTTIDFLPTRPVTR